MYGYDGEKLRVNHFWELKVRAPRQVISRLWPVNGPLKGRYDSVKCKNKCYKEARDNKPKEGNNLRSINSDERYCVNMKLHAPWENEICGHGMNNSTSCRNKSNEFNSSTVK